MRVKCLAQEHNAMTRPGLEPVPSDPESKALTIRPPRHPHIRVHWFYFIFSACGVHVVCILEVSVFGLPVKQSILFICLYICSETCLKQTPRRPCLRLSEAGVCLIWGPRITGFAVYLYIYIFNSTCIICQRQNNNNIVDELLRQKYSLNLR